jgi:hypothetical protein
MYKNLRIIFLTIILGLSTLSLFSTTFAEPTTRDLNVNFDAKNGVTNRNDYVDNFGSSYGSYFFGGDLTGEKGAKYLMITIARDLKNIATLLAVVFLFILVLKIIFSSGSEEDVKKWKHGIIFTSIGIVVMQIAYILIATLYDKKVDSVTASDFLDKIIYPFIRMLELLASFAFLAMGFYAFYLIITA